MVVRVSDLQLKGDGGGGERGEGGKEGEGGREREGGLTLHLLLNDLFLKSGHQANFLFSLCSTHPLLLL